MPLIFSSSSRSLLINCVKEYFSKRCGLKKAREKLISYSKRLSRSPCLNVASLLLRDVRLPCFFRSRAAFSLARSRSECDILILCCVYIYLLMEKLYKCIHSLILLFHIFGCAHKHIYAIILPLTRFFLSIY